MRKYLLETAEQGNPEINAAAYLGLWLAFGVFCFLSLSDLVGMPIAIGNATVVGLSVVVPRLVINYFLFIYEDRYTRIVTYPNHGNHAEGSLKSWDFVMIFLLPLILCLIPVFFRMKI